ncbi:hypothetical protein [Ramlibacter sp. AN1133]|uniref:hypothetical protein n=1 Tax=Ramlibacter sp. AN1133 TaxID=3133429 RepID=UPI0030C40E91
MVPDPILPRQLNRSVLVLWDLTDPAALARMGWRAPVLACIGLEKGALVGADFSYLASAVDVAGTLRARQELRVTSQAAREMQREGKQLPWEAALGGITSLDAQDLTHIRRHLTKRGDEAGPNVFAALCAVMDRYTAGTESSWQDFLARLEKDRYTASAWFERDRAQLGLRDEVLDRDVLSLWDDDVRDAIDSGFLATPGRPRPSESEWLEPLLAYANEQGLTTSLRAPEAQPIRERNRP